MRNNEVKQYINPDNFELNIKVLNNIKETINTLKSKNIIFNTHIQNISNELKTREERINNIIRNILSTLENLKKEENKIISNDKQAVIDEVKYVEYVLDNKGISNIDAKEKELIKRKESIKNKKYDAETRAIIDLLYTEVLDKLEAEKSGKILAGTTYKDIRTIIKNITNLNFYNN